MSNYDFSTLSPTDFEELSRDLLQEEFGVHLENFRTGRDKGIDLRYSKPECGNCWIVQAKHFARSGFSALRSCLGRTEKPKAKELNPSRYIVTTSVSMDPTQKDKLVKTLDPYCTSSGDIFSAEDLNNLLGKYPNVEKRHFKLWLTSTSVLQSLLDNGIYGQSHFEMETIKRQIAMFVPTDALRRAEEMLRDSGLCMLTGIPGIGKTTTARLLVAQHLQDGWDGVYMTSQTRDAMKVFVPERKQIVFYDDFLGVLDLQDRMTKNDDKDLHVLIQACQRNPNKKRLVLTTRESLFSQAIQLSEVLSKRARVEAAKSVVQLEDYNHEIRAQILVNHLHFYEIAPDVCSAFVKSGQAQLTLHHPNYNPRIIETVCQMPGIRDLSAQEFGKTFIKKLDDPGEIWDHAYQNQLSEMARWLLLVFAMHGSSVSVDGLAHHFRIFVKQMGKNLIGFNDTFVRCLKELDGSFLTIDRTKDYHCVSYHNPAIEDFTDALLKRDSDALEIALKSFEYQGVLLFAAGQLVKRHPNRVKLEDCIDAMSRCDRTTKYCVRDLVLRNSMEEVIRPEIAIRLWAEILLSFDQRDGDLSAIEACESFFAALEPGKVKVDDVDRLYSLYVSLCFKTKAKLAFPGSQIGLMLLEGCETPTDFREVVELFVNDDNYDERVRAIGERFLKSYALWLQQTLDDVSSAEEVDDAIYEVRRTAEELKIDESIFDFQDAEEQSRELSEQEESDSEEERDETRIWQSERESKQRKVYDILASLCK
ncbi:hypothetical protein CA51_42490 [Rosistilla oblonga]|uniref:nSTAND3 domain-containing NTPase n=1 Tax=Rosistilla oblonga TaxID=2527990 RepID=UPI001187A7BE|nr:restriction endonuclease [Rosistilla oblonga]QDV14350.1 hypothetical protein CA51_42490 [Rosistilla oblonga]